MNHFFPSSPHESLLPESEAESEFPCLEGTQAHVLFAINPLPLLVVEVASGKLLEVNEAAIRLYGRSAGELVNSPLQALWASGFPGAFFRADRPEEVCSILTNRRWTHRREDGEPFEAEVICRPFMSGSLPAVLLRVEEIHRRPQGATFEAALSDLGRKLSEAATPSEAGQIIADVSRGLLGWDAFHITLHQPETGLLLPVLTLDTIDGVLTDFTEGFSSATPASSMFQGILAEGSRLVLRREGDGLEADTPYGDMSRRSESLLFVAIRKGERAVGVLSVQSYRRDAYSESDLRVLEALATHCAGALERLRTEAALRTAEQRFVLAFESSPMAMFIGDGDGRALAVNSAFEQIFGFEAAEVIGRTGLELNFWSNPDDRVAIYAAIRRGRQVRDMQVQLRTKSGDARLILLSVEPIEVDGQRCLLFFNYDITDRVKLEGQLRQSQKLESIGQVAAGVAHDFNNLLTVIEGCTSLALARPCLDPDSRELLEQVSSSAERGAKLTRQLLAFSSRQNMVRKQLSLETLFGDLDKMLRRLLGEGIALKFRVAEELPAVFADSGMIEQVVVNMVVNARDAMGSRGELLIEAFEPAPETAPPGEAPGQGSGTFACLRISDTGCGIPPGNLPRIFEPFFTTREIGRGSGLGLASAYGIVKQHGGWIDVRSGIGEGTVFSVYLPVCQEGASELRSDEPPPAVMPGKERVLVVEDEPAVRDLMCHILQFYGYETVQAESGPAALETWEEQGSRIDAIVTDIVMPGGMDGRELARVLLAKRPDLPVLYTSGYSPMIAGQDLALQDGVNFLQKPFEAVTLAKTLRDCIDRAVSS